jgi:hypothetical protein
VATYTAVDMEYIHYIWKYNCNLNLANEKYKKDIHLLQYTTSGIKRKFHMFYSIIITIIRHSRAPQCDMSD